MHPTEHEALGYWWNESTPDQKVPGTLKMGQERNYTLNLLGAIGSTTEPDVELRPNIHGTSGGKLFTFIEPWRAQITERISEDGLKETEERWDGFKLVEGGHILASTKFDRTSIGYVGLSSLWDKVLRNDVSDESLMPENQAEFEDANGGRLMFTRSRTSHYGRGSQSYEDQITIRIESSQPLTLDEWSEKYWYPLATLISLATGTASESSVYTLASESAKGDGEVLICEVDRWKTKNDSTWARHASLIGTSDPFLPTVMQKWLLLSSALIKPMVVAAPSKQSGYLDTETFTAIAAAEQLQRFLDGSLPTPFADKVKEKLSANSELLGLNSNARRRIVSLLANTEYTLEDRLKLLMGAKPKEIYVWYLHDNVHEWAKSSARLRNILGHGLLGSESSSLDPMLLLDARDAARDVIAIRLLLECGFPEAKLMERIEADSNWRWRRTRMSRWSEHSQTTESSP